MLRTALLIIVFSITSLSAQQPPLAQQAFESLQAGNAPGALILYQKLLDQNPADTLAHYYSGVCHYQLGQFDRCIGNLDFASRSRRFSVRAFYLLSQVQQAVGQNETALISLQTTIKEDSSFAPAFTAMTGLLAAMNRFPEAVQVAESAPTVDAMLALGRFAIDWHMNREALQLARQIMRQDSASYPSKSLLADAYLACEFPDSALAVYNDLHQHHRYPLLLKKMAACSESLGRFRAAQKYLSQYLAQTSDSSLTLISDLGRYYYNRAFYDTSADQRAVLYDSAKFLFQQAMKRDTAMAYTHYNLGLCYYSINQFKEADREFQLALQYSKPSLSLLLAAQSNLAASYLAQKKYKTARKAYLKVLDYDPDHAAAHYYLGILQHTLGDIDRAKYYYERFRRLSQGKIEYREMQADTEKRLKILKASR